MKYLTQPNLTKIKGDVNSVRPESDTFDQADVTHKSGPDGIKIPTRYRFWEKAISVEQK